MALFAKQFSLFLLLISLLSSHARESQFFNKATAATNDDVVSYTKQPETSQFLNKASATTTNDVVPYTEQPEASPQPDFFPDNENGHGLYGQDSGLLPPSAATTEPNNKHLPRNYNPVAYVTQPDDINDSTAAFTEDKNSFYGGAQNYYIAPEDKEPEYRNSYYNGGGSSFNSGGGGANGFEPQGMSDTRKVENGKYYYDVEAEKYNSNHPYESLKRSSVRNGYEVDGGKNSIGGYYQNQQYELQDDEENNNNWRP